jgi:hypothetical protein
MDRKLIGILVGGALVMSVTAWFYSQKKASPVKPEDRRFMHCPQCLKELPYEALRAEKGCQLCGAKDELVPTKESLKTTGEPPSLGARLIVPLLIEANVLLGVVMLYFYLTSRWKRTKEDEALYMECDHCHQRLRYKSSRGGQVGQCPRCKHRLLFPRPILSPEDERLAWWHPRQWRKQLTKQWNGFKGKAFGHPGNGTGA